LYVEITLMLDFMARLHPLVVHLPIGLLLFAFLMSLLPSGQRERVAPALVLAVALTAVSALAACLSGYLLRTGGEYDEVLSLRHQWLGIATGAVSFAAWVWPSGRRPLVWLSTGLMVVAGHLGGTLTHGEGYLFPSSGDGAVVAQDTAGSAEPPLSSAASVGPSMVHPYRDAVTPILRDKCEGCHSAAKRKGGLRLDGEAWIRKGGRNGKVLISGDPSGSPLYAHLLRPLDDDLHMPPKGKRQLMRAEIAVIHRWVEAGAPFGPVPASDTVVVGREPLSEDADAGEAVAGEGMEVSVPPPPPVLPKPDTGVVEALRRRGAIVQEVMTGSHGLYVSLIHAAAVDDSLMHLVGRLSEQTLELRAGGMDLTDPRFLSLPAFPHLRRLDLSRTRVTDGGLLRMERFPELEVLNLYGTGVGDGIAETLRPCGRLRRLYLWRTAVTETGLRRLRMVHPAVQADGVGPAGGVVGESR